jgi:hypothetical protein
MGQEFILKQEYICVTLYFMYGVSHEGQYCTFNKILVRKAQISVESYLVY